ncbi:lysosome-associated membrane glycoprotein 2 isoform 2-T2 [Pholidichthys leucotaenia]
MTPRCTLFVLMVASGIVLQLSYGVEVNVTGPDEKLCLCANLMLNFSVSYEVADKKNATVSFELPDAVKTDGSKCGDESSELQLHFGNGHFLSVSFSKQKGTYQADLINFTYNLNDSSIFKDSVSHETMTVSVMPQITNVSLDTCYVCKSEDLIKAKNVNMTLWNVLIQAFVSNGTKSENLTVCAADTPTPSPTNTTTTSTPATTPTPTPTPTLPTPTTRNYNVTKNNTVCLLAIFGLRIGFNQTGENYQEMNFGDADVKASGSCEVNSSKLHLESNKITIDFTFTNDTKKFKLHELSINITSSVFSQSNSNLSMWEASVGSSYMCNNQQNYTITSQLSLFTFNLHIQPFGVKNGAFSTAHECSVDDTSILIPIIVGAALVGLILIVVIAYVIGRRKTYIGYQTL